MLDGVDFELRVKDVVPDDLDVIPAEDFVPRNRGPDVEEQLFAMDVAADVGIWLIGGTEKAHSGIC